MVFACLKAFCQHQFLELKRAGVEFFPERVVLLDLCWILRSHLLHGLGEVGLFLRLEALVPLMSHGLGGLAREVVENVWIREVKLEEYI